MSYFNIYKINDYLIQFKDALGSLATLVIGTQKALLIDTGYGIGDLPKEISEYTKLPLVVIDSHGHMDHTGGNYQFKEVYISDKDINLCIKHNSYEWRVNNIKEAKNRNALPINFNEDKYYKENEGNLKLLDFKEIDLGNIKVKIIDLPGHTLGSIGFFLVNKKILITSDAICAFVWLFLEESTTVSEYINSVKQALEIDFNYFLVGHTPGLIKKDEMIRYYDIACSIDMSLSGKVNFNNFDHLNAYAYPMNDLYKVGCCGIVFDPNKIK